MKRNLLIIAILGMLFSCGKAPVDYVNPLIGTARENYGGLAPFVARPYGMTKFTPQTHDNAVCMGPYVHEDTVLIGFLASHQPMVECMGDYGSVSLMPQCGGEVRVKNEGRGMRMDKASEKSRAYGYSVSLTDDGGNKVDASMSAMSRAGIMSFAFPEDIAPRIIVQGLHLPAEFENFLNDINARRAILEGWIRVDAEKGEITGYNPDRQSHMWGPELEGFKGWFVIRFDRPITSWGCWDDENTYSGLGELKSKVRNGAWVDFAPGTGTVRAQIGTSFIGEKEAREAIGEELHGWNLRRLERQVRRSWASRLRKLTVDGVDDDQKTIFYTAVFHAYHLPRELGEDGRYYSAYDDEVHEGVSFTDFATWDTFRALHPLMTMLEPELTASWIRALIDIYEQGGWLPKWPNPSYTNVMIGTHADAIISDAYMKGIRDYDTVKAFEAMMKDATVPPDNDTIHRWIDRENTRDYEARAGLTYYLSKGYIPCDKTSESVSRCVEFCVDDWAIAQVARDMGRTDIYDTLISHSHNWKNHYQKEIGYLAPRLSDGSWFHADSTSLMTYTGNMYFPHEGFTEANPRCYMFGAMHDVPEMVELFGREWFIKKLDETYDQHYYSHDNEPSHHYDYLYNFVGMPWKTQEKVRMDIENAYANKPSGMVGNDDCGQMSAWYLLSSMGIYPMTPASNRMELGAPQLPRIRMKLRGHTLTMTAEGLSEKNKYVKEGFIDGRRITRPYITWDEFISARNLRFVMTDAPCDSWAEK